MFGREEQRLVDRDVSRRAMLKALGIGGGVAAVGFAGFFGQDVVNAAENGDDIQTMINYAATAEALAVTAFYNIIKSSSFYNGLADVWKMYIRSALTSEAVHLDFLIANGAKPLATQFYVPEQFLTSLPVYVAVTDVLESAFIGAYLASIRRFAELGQPLLAEVGAQVMGVEAEHRAMNRAMGNIVGGDMGINPTNIALERPTLQQVSQAGPILAPVLTGGSGFIGPVPLPAHDEAYNAGMALEPVPLAVNAFGSAVTVW